MTPRPVKPADPTYSPNGGKPSTLALAGVILAVVFLAVIVLALSHV